MGEELPRPGIAVFHRTPSLSFHSTGMSLSAAMPVPLGPRNRGHDSPEADIVAKTMARTTRTGKSWVRSSRIIALPLGGKKVTGEGCHNPLSYTLQSSSASPWLQLLGRVSGDGYRSSWAIFYQITAIASLQNGCRCRKLHNDRKEKRDLYYG